MAGLKAAKDMGRKGGRPSSLMLDDLVAARALLRDKEITVKEVAKRLKVDPSTLYRHLPGGRSAVKESATSKV
jgi:DNA invertase Pin-like site-specific DNA recombinase